MNQKLNTQAQDDTTSESRILVSHLTLRRLIGILGILLPFILATGCYLLCACTGILESVSSYYDTPMRDVFVGTLFTIGFFLFAYKGYERVDDIAGDLGCVFALGVALFPTTSPSEFIEYLHLFFAACLFTTFTYFSIFLFTKSGGDGKGGFCSVNALYARVKSGDREKKRKVARNRIYVTCGIVIVLCIALIGLVEICLEESPLTSLNPVFWLESVALLAFGISWLVKGETLWKDEVG